MAVGEFKIAFLFQPVQERRESAVGQPFRARLPQDIAFVHHNFIFLIYRYRLVFLSRVLFADNPHDNYFLENLFPTFSTDCILAVVSLRERAGVRASASAFRFFTLSLSSARSSEGIFAERFPAIRVGL